MSIRQTALLAVICLFAGCGGTSTEVPGLQKLQSTSVLLRRAGSLSAAVAADTTSVDRGMTKDRARYVRRQAARLLVDSMRLKTVDGRALKALAPLPARLSGPARQYAWALISALRTQKHEAGALISVGRRIRIDPLLERNGSLKVLGTELQARRDAARVSVDLRRAARIRRAHPKAFTYVPQSNG